MTPGVATVQELTPGWVLPLATREAILQWFGMRAAAVDGCQLPAHEGVRFAAQQGWLKFGIPSDLGGWDDELEPMVEVIALAARGCFASAFSLWSQRMMIAYAAASHNTFLRREVLPELLRGARFGATGLANAMRHAIGLEALALQARRVGEDFVLNGRLPWASNLVPGTFVVAIAASREDGKGVVLAVPAETPGLVREADFSLIALEATQTTALQFHDAHVPARWLLSDDFTSFMQAVRPTFLLLQCGFCWGLAEASLLAAAGARDRLTRQVLDIDLKAAREALGGLVDRLRLLIRVRQWNPAQRRDLLQVRLDLVTLATQAVWLELAAMGGAAYRKAGPTARRIREAAFLPIQAPTTAQLRWELAQMAEEAR
jgi:alkylation response protein AidB-like acyl-CoA dehydrogenase